jgi:hypothetical protein
MQEDQGWACDRKGRTVELNGGERALGSGRGQGEQVLVLDSEGGGTGPLMLVCWFCERGDSGEGKRGRR